MSPYREGRLLRVPQELQKLGIAALAVINILGTKFEVGVLGEA